MSRAKPLAPDERRAAIVLAARPLVLRDGGDVTTKQIAEAAGVAEGTLFRVFGNKDEIVAAVVDDALDPAALTAEIAAINHDAPLRDVIAACVTVIREHGRRMNELMAALHALGRTRPQHHASKEEAHEAFLRRYALLVEAMAATLQPHTYELRVAPETAATFIQVVTFATGFRSVTGAALNDETTLVDLLYHALALHPTDPTHPGER